MKTYLADNVKARILHPDGSYELLKPTEENKALRAQDRLIALARERDLASLPYEEAIRHRLTDKKRERPLAKKTKALKKL